MRVRRFAILVLLVAAIGAVVVAGRRWVLPKATQVAASPLQPPIATTAAPPAPASTASSGGSGSGTPTGAAPSAAATSPVRTEVIAVASPTSAGPTAWRAGIPTNPKNLKGKPIVVADVPRSAGTDYFAATARGMQDAARELGNVKVTTDGPAEADTERQIESLGSDITKGVDYLLFAANDPVAVSPVLRKALAKGIGVVGYDTDAAENARQFFISPVDVEAVAAQVVDLAARNAGDNAQVAVVTGPQTAPDQGRWVDAIKAQLASRHPGIKLLDVRPTDEVQHPAFNVTQQLMVAHPELQAVIGLSLEALPGAADVVSQAGKCDKIYVIGVSTPKAMKKFVDSGCVKDVVTWNAVDLGYATVYAARALADGTLNPGDTELAAGRLGRLRVTGSTIQLGKPIVVTKDSIGNYDF